MLRWGLVLSLLGMVFAGQAEALTTDQRLSKLEAQITLLSELNQQQSDMKEQMLQVNGQLEKVTHDLETVQAENRNLIQALAELREGVAQQQAQALPKKTGPPIVSLNPEPQKLRTYSQ